MGNNINITLEKEALKKEPSIMLSMKIPQSTKKQFEKLRTHYQISGKELFVQIIGQVYDQTFEGGK